MGTGTIHQAVFLSGNELRICLGFTGLTGCLCYTNLLGAELIYVLRWNKFLALAERTSRNVGIIPTFPVPDVLSECFH